MAVTTDRGKKTGGIVAPVAALWTAVEANQEYNRSILKKHWRSTRPEKIFSTPWRMTR
jgi:hypothetical protein